MQAVSLVTPDLLPQAQVLARSLREHAGGELQVVLVGRSTPAGEWAFPITTVGEELGLDLESALSRHDPDVLTMRLVPLLLAQRSLGGEPTLHLPPTSWVLGGLDPLREALGSNPVVLFARTLADPPDDGLDPRPRVLSQAGRISDRVMAASGERALDFLTWWAGHLEEALGPLDDKGPAASVEARAWLPRFLELAPSRFDASVVDDPGLTLSYWNLPGHGVSMDSAGRDGHARPVVDEQHPLRLIDLRGFAPDRPWQLSPEAGRVRLSREPALRELTERYGRELRAAGWSDASRRREVGRELAPGIVFDGRLSALLGLAMAMGRDFGDVFSPAGRDAFLAWLRELAPEGGAHGVTRYLYRVYRERPDVPVAYPDLDGKNGPEFIAWCWVFGQQEVDIPPAFLPDKPPQLDLADPRHPVVGVRVTGYFEHTLGLGSAARGYVEALRAAGVPVITASIPPITTETPPPQARDYGRLEFEALDAEVEHAMEIVAVNHDELPQLVAQVGGDYFRGPKIGIWAWETDVVPARWSRSFELVDEIWVNSRYMAQNIGRGAPVPVLAFPPAVTARPSPPVRLGVPDGFLFLFVFDYFSTLRRKNPVGLVRAFQRAFAPGEGPRLLIKTLNAPLRPLAEEELLWACEERPDIHVIDRSLSGKELDGLMSACDSFVSLHRAEGYGLALAEAMALGKPVIATRYSGNMDFMTAANSLLVDYTLTRVGADVEIYPSSGEWAEPSIEHAAELMRWVVERPDEAAALGRRAARDIAEQLSPEACGRAMRARLELLSRWER